MSDNLGTIPEGGNIISALTSNGCADNIDDPSSSGIFNGKGVWFSFTPPLSGHIIIDIDGDPTDQDEMNVEFAVLESSDNSCTGNFSTVETASNNALLDESRELSCLNPQTTYYILVDGQGNAAFRSGIFQIEIRDAGDDTPVENQTVTLCAGATLPVGNNLYDQTGMYSDTIILTSGCDSIVNTDLTVLSEIFFDLIIEQPGIGENMPNGIATITANGGTNSFTYNWSNGTIGQTATNLIGNETYCVDVTDTNNCLMDTCFIQPLILNFLPVVIGDSLACNGDTNGELTFGAQFGFPPYNFNWQSADGQQSGSGVLLDENDTETFSNLPAGIYQIFMEDMMFDTTFSIEIWEPDLITLSMQNVVNASCFGINDGEISIEIAGGTPPYLVDWSNGTNVVTAIDQLFAGSYNVIIADANACVTQFFFEVTQPDSIILAFDTKDVSCFEGNDGSITVTSPNTDILDYFWLNIGATTATVDGLEGGVYTVGILDDNGCPAVDSTLVETPTAPLAVTINLVSPIICNGGNEGSLSAEISGPGGAISYNWSNGVNISEISSLTAGIYSVTVENENGCTAEASFVLDEPAVLAAEASTIGVTCPGGLTDGILTIDTVFGGQGPYLFSDNGIAFSPQMEFTDQTAGPIFYYVQDALGCVAEFMADIEDVPNIQVDLGEDLSIQLGDSIQLSAAVTAPNLIYTWEPLGIADCDDCFNIFVRPMENLEALVTVLDPDSGCTDTDEVFVEVIKERRFYAPNVFSPNDDGVNDKFLVFGQNDVRIVKTLKIFNRYGALVFEANDFIPGTPDNAWNGFFRNKRLDPDVFGWFAEVEFFDGAVEIYRGDVTLLR